MNGGSQSFDVVFYDTQDHSFEAKKVLKQSIAASLGQRDKKKKYHSYVLRLMSTNFVRAFPCFPKQFLPLCYRFCDSIWGAQFSSCVVFRF